MSGGINIPYGFAKAHGVLLVGAGGESADVLLREDGNLAALTELRRTLGLPLNVESVSRSAFEARLAETYSQQDGSAAEVVADVGQEVDLSQLMTELPPVEDL
ncbi:MAG: type II secretion system protein GspE, partial [Rhodocyclaceae bacterium]